MADGKFLLLFLLSILAVTYAIQTRGSYKTNHGAEIVFPKRQLKRMKNHTGGYQMMCRGMMCSNGNGGGGGSYNVTLGKGMGMRFPEMSVFQ